MFKMRMDMIKTITFLLIAFVMMQASPDVYAAIVVQPDRHIVEVSPGEIKQVEYTIENRGLEPLDIIIDPVGWAGTEDIYSWISLDSHKLYIDKEDTNTLTIDVTAPADGDGEAVGMLFLCYKESEDAALNMRNGIPIYIVVEGTQKYELILDSIDANITENKQQKILDIAISVINESNAHIRPDVALSIIDKEGIIVYQTDQEKPKILLRGQKHTYNLRWRNPKLRKEEYFVKIDFSDDGKVDIKKELTLSVTDSGIEIEERTNS